MTPDEIKSLFAMMREFKVYRFKNGDLEVSIDVAEIESGQTFPPITDEDAKYWSAPEPTPEDDETSPTTT